MADDASEDWYVPQRRGMLAAAAIPLVLLLLVVSAGWSYNRYLAPAHRAPIKTLPAPGIETYIHDGAGDPHRPVVPGKPDSRLDAAKRATIAQGWPR